MGFSLALDIFAAALTTGARPCRGMMVVHEETTVPATLEETFAFFSDATNLEKLTPPWLNFQIRGHRGNTGHSRNTEDNTETSGHSGNTRDNTGSSGPLAMREGLEIDYAIVLHGVPIPWKTRIDVWEPGVRFVDRQVNGPYVWWHHEHRFEATADGTRVIDQVEFVPRLRWLTGGFVRRDVQRIFRYRETALKELFARAQPPKQHSPQKQHRGQH